MSVKGIVNLMRIAEAIAQKLRKNGDSAQIF